MLFRVAQAALLTGPGLVFPVHVAAAALADAILAATLVVQLVGILPLLRRLAGRLGLFLVLVVLLLVFRLLRLVWLGLRSRILREGRGHMGRDAKRCGGEQSRALQKATSIEDFLVTGELSHRFRCLQPDAPALSDPTMSARFRPPDHLPMRCRGYNPVRCPSPPIPRPLNRSTNASFSSFPAKP